ALRGHLAWRPAQAAHDPFQHAPQRRGAPQAGRAAAEEDARGRRAQLAARRPHLELGQHRAGVALMVDRRRLRGVAGEVTVRALGQAPGEVDVDRGHVLERYVSVPRPSSRFVAGYLVGCYPDRVAVFSLLCMLQLEEIIQRVRAYQPMADGEL